MKNKKLILINSCLIITLLVLQGFFLYYGYDKTLDDIGYNAMTIAKTVVNAIDIDEYEKLLQNKERNDYFYKTQKYFRQVQRQTGVKYLYTEHKISNSQIEYILDAEKDSLGEQDELYTPKAHTSKTSFNTRVEDSGIWGTLITGYSPIINKEGEIIGTVGVDIDVKDFYHELMSRLIKVLSFFLASILVISLLIYLTLKEEINERKRAEKNLVKKTASLTNLLNNAGQGFLTFGDNLLVDEEYSNECQNLFGQEPADKVFPALIFTHDQQQQEFLSSILKEIFQEKNETKRNVYLTLLPEEVSINNRSVRIEYKLINAQHQENSTAVMAILTDITEKRLLENRMENERKILKMVVKAIVNREDLINTITDFRNFCLTGKQRIVEGNQPPEEIIAELFRIIHTFKGTFSLLGLINIADKLHDFETQIYELSQNNLTLSDIKNLLDDAKLSQWLDKDLEILKDILDEQFFRQDRFIEESKLIKLEQKMHSILAPADYELFLKETARLRYRPFRELLKAYPEHLKILAEKQDKLLNLLSIEGGDILVETVKYLPFTKSLIHVFRNIVDHGLEPAEDRIEQGKNEYGTITCLIKTINHSISLMIADDGKGINLTAIREKVVINGIYNEETAAKLTNKEILALIFRDNLSTKENFTHLSGRGVGLAAVKEALDKLGGRVEVKTEPGQGTMFHFIIPLTENIDLAANTKDGEDGNGTDSGC